MMKSLIKGSVALGLFGWLTSSLVACGDDNTVDLQPSPFRTEAGFCAELAKVVCSDEVLNSCYLSSSDSLAQDRDSCIDAVQDSDFCNPNSRQYHQDRAEACVAAQQTAYRDARLDQSELDAIKAACDIVFNDGRLEGNTCQADADCATEDDLFCVGKPGAEHTCQTPVEVMPGDSCAQPEEICAPTHYCGSDDACIVRRSVGDDCDPTRPCGQGSLCLGQVCVELLANGESCGADEQCEGGFCITPPGNSMGTCGSAVELASTNTYCAPFLP